MYLTDFQTLLPSFVLLPSLSLTELESCYLTQAVTHSSSLTLFSYLHFSPVLCSLSICTHYLSLCLQPPVLRQAQQLSSGPSSSQHHPGEGTLGKREDLLLQVLNTPSVLSLCRCTSLFPGFYSTSLCHLVTVMRPQPNCYSINSS